VLIPWFAISSNAGTMPEWCQADPPWAAQALNRSCAVAVFGNDTPIWRARQSTIEILLVQLDAEAWIEGAPDLARARRSRYYALADRPRRMVARLERRFSS
jgi:hypothetical protein